MTHTIAIIGAGFSGAATAINLLTRHGHKPLEITLINRHANLARGVAYGTHSPSHLLNVPAGRMSLFPDRENDFFEFAREWDDRIHPSSFVPRSLYGHYLETRLQQAVDQAPGARLRALTGEVVDLHLNHEGRQATLHLVDGPALTVERVVLAVGNYPPADPGVPDAAFFQCPRYVRDPWAPGALEKIPQAQATLLIGTGLTMMDVALELNRRDPASTLFALSRRGLLPQGHRDLPAMPHPAPPAGLFTEPASARRYLRFVRDAVKEGAGCGQDWRDVIGALRPLTPALWQALPETEQRRFLRHAQPYWDIHRHRTAPASAARLDALRASGRLQVRAGYLKRLEPLQNGVRVHWKPRGPHKAEILEVAMVINCTGPQNDLRRLPDPLIRALLGQGLLTPDPLALGVRVDPEGALLDNAGRASGVLFYTGPLLKARDWEATAVPELRVAARRLADRLAGAW